MPASNDTSKYFVPTNTVNFYAKEVSVEPKSFYSRYESKENNLWTLEIVKPCPTFDDGARQQALTYDVKDFVFPKYRFQYRKTVDADWEPISNPYLKNISICAYVTTKTGLWYIRDNTLFFLDAKSGKNTKIGRIENVIDLQMTQSGVIHATVCKEIKLVGKNKFYSLMMGDYEGYKDIYELAVKKLNINPARFANQINGWTQTFYCPKCHTPLYSGMDSCPQCGAALGNTENLRDPYEQEIVSFTASPQMKPEGSEHYFRLDYAGRFSDCYYTLKYGRNWNCYCHFDRISYDDSTNLLYYLTDAGYLIESTIEEKNRKVLCKISERAGHNQCHLVANDSGIYIVKNKTNLTTVLWLTKSGKEVKTIRLSGTIKQTYICGNLLFYIRTESILGRDCGSAYWMNISDGQEHCITRGQRETIRKNVESSHSYGNVRSISVEQIFGNERGAVVQIEVICYDDADTLPDDQIKQLDSSGWYFYSFADQQRLSCLNNPYRGAHLAYTNPEEYAKWEKKSRENRQQPNGLSIIGFDMAKNLMWVAIRKNGRNYRAPMNITTDPQKRLRPDLPMWQEPQPGKEVFPKVSFFFQQEPTYFDGKRYYVFPRSGNENFFSVNTAGEREEWPIRTTPFRLEGFSVQGEQVFISGMLRPDQREIPGIEALKDSLDSERIGSYRFPASHKLEKILGYSFYGFDCPFRWYHDDEEKWLTRAYDEGKKADSEAYLAHLEEEKAAEKKQQEEIARREKEEQGQFASATPRAATIPQPTPAPEALSDAWNWDAIVEKTWQTSADEEPTEQEKGASPKPVFVKEPANRLEYWEGFAEYARTVLVPGMTLSKTADRSWYAIRLGSAKIRIECSVNSRAGTLRAAFFVQDAPEIFAKAQQVSHMIDALLSDLGTVIWDENSRAANISLNTTQTGKSTWEQYEWFCEAANRLNKSILPYLGI